jgi:hypothetical protein
MDEEDILPCVLLPIGFELARDGGRLGLLELGREELVARWEVCLLARLAMHHTSCRCGG